MKLKIEEARILETKGLYYESSQRWEAARVVYSRAISIVKGVNTKGVECLFAKEIIASVEPRLEYVISKMALITR